MDPALYVHPGQTHLTREQGAEVKRFAEVRLAAQLSMEPVDEAQAEAWLRDAYRVAGLAPPNEIIWLDGPVALVLLLGPLSMWERKRGHMEASVWERVWESLRDSLKDGLRDDVFDNVRERVRANVQERVQASVGKQVWKRVEDSVRERLRASMVHSMRQVRVTVWNSVRKRLWENLEASVRERVFWFTSFDDGRDSAWDSVRASVWTSVRAYTDAPWLTIARFFAEYLAPNELSALARFNELVSGYWLGTDRALLVRKPRVLGQDAVGRWHAAHGKCLEYPDGWGFYAWHGVRVPEKVILMPERLTREDFLGEGNVEVRRVIQERMGERFVPELGGVVLDSSPRGALYEVALPYDPDRVARYVQVQDASTERQYFLRVPPTIQTAAEAVAWSFGITVEDYHPAQET